MATHSEYLADEVLKSLQKQLIHGCDECLPDRKQIVIEAVNQFLEKFGMELSQKNSNPLERLRNCKHRNCSISDGRLTVCFDCGATIAKSEGETVWTIPFLWRSL